MEPINFRIGFFCYIQVISFRTDTLLGRLVVIVTFGSEGEFGSPTPSHPLTQPNIAYRNLAAISVIAVSLKYWVVRYYASTENFPTLSEYLPASAK